MVKPSLTVGLPSAFLVLIEKNFEMAPHVGLVKDVFSY